MAIVASILGGFVGLLAFLIGLAAFDLSVVGAAGLCVQTGFSIFALLVIVAVAQRKSALATVQLHHPEDIRFY